MKLNSPDNCKLPRTPSVLLSKILRKLSLLTSLMALYNSSLTDQIKDKPGPEGSSKGRRARGPSFVKTCQAVFSCEPSDFNEATNAV